MALSDCANSLTTTTTATTTRTRTRTTTSPQLHNHNLDNHNMDNHNHNMDKPLAAVLFDIDGTLVNSDPIHFAVFQELLLNEEALFVLNNSESNQNQNNNEKNNKDDEPIDEAFFRKWIAGRANNLIAADFFPDWSIEKRQAWSIRKEERFREMAQSSMMELKMKGLDKFRDWIDQPQRPNDDSASPTTTPTRTRTRVIKKAAVTNAPRLNAEAILSGIQYSSWFLNDGGFGDGENNNKGKNSDSEFDFHSDSYNLVIGDECERPKPDPCPYLTACALLGVSADQCLVVEDSPSGAKAGVAAGAFVIGILSGQTQSALEDAGCHLIIKDFDDPKLWDYLERRIQVQ